MIMGPGVIFVIGFVVFFLLCFLVFLIHCLAKKKRKSCHQKNYHTNVSVDHLKLSLSHAFAVALFWKSSAMSVVNNMMVLGGGVGVKWGWGGLTFDLTPWGIKKTSACACACTCSWNHARSAFDPLLHPIRYIL